MKPEREIIVKIFILVFAIVLLSIQILQIDIRILQIIITIVVVLLTLVIVIVEIRRPKRLCRAFIYQHKENRTIIYCENDEGDETRDFRKVGEGRVPCDLVNKCFFAK